ncbi:hypothetical protein LguiA_030592 [Lonicera macranthoides]
MISGHGSYQPLHQPDDPVTLNISEKNPISSEHSKFRDEPKERLSSKIKKKVSFNLNVRTYEPIQNEEVNDHFSDEEPEKDTISKLQPQNDSTGSRTGPYPSNHRYQNFRDSYDEYDDDIELEESDIDDNFVTDEEEEEYSRESDDDYESPKTSQKENLDPFYSSKTDSGKSTSFSRSDEGETGNFLRIRALKGEEVQKVESNRVRDRSQYVHSVLNPVENLTQWKAIKARATPTVKKQKENIVTKQEQVPLGSSQSFCPLPSSDKLNSNPSEPLIQGFAVDSSLSNWLNSSKMETK